MKEMSYDISFHQNDVPMFQNHEIQKLWENLHFEWFDCENPEYEPYLATGIHLVVDTIEVHEQKQLRLLALYNSQQRTFITDEDELEAISLQLSVEYNRDRQGKWLGNPEDEGVDYGYKLGQICPTCKTANRSMYDDQPHLAHYCDCSRGRWDDQV